MRNPGTCGIEGGLQGPAIPFPGDDDLRKVILDAQQPIGGLDLGRACQKVECCAEHHIAARGVLLVHLGCNHVEASAPIGQDHLERSFSKSVPHSAGSRGEIVHWVRRNAKPEYFRTVEVINDTVIDPLA